MSNDFCFLQSYSICGFNDENSNSTVNEQHLQICLKKTRKIQCYTMIYFSQQVFSSEDEESSSKNFGKFVLLIDMFTITKQESNAKVASCLLIFNPKFPIFEDSSKRFCLTSVQVFVITALSLLLLISTNISGTS
eukprot:TRINITY_DN1962_c0_g1_i1.p1 TRINITY_DN1962_c0_g1~~TRINITY_DN1962_c0_g1_i1.p1  ORF type:complete len:135 (+),score=32.16 TRINITY_DN1962_c0_g1_i1:774-1178(+)